MQWPTTVRWNTRVQRATIIPRMSRHIANFMTLVKGVLAVVVVILS